MAEGSPGAQEPTEDGATPEPGLADLPVPVRAAIIDMTAAVLPDIADLPASLRKVAAFAQRRRARAGAGAIAAALGSPEFRTRVAPHVARQEPPTDPVGLAAYHWLVRSEGWIEHLSQALAGVQSVQADVFDERDRLLADVRRLRDALERQSAEHERAAQALRSENTKLRQRLGELRAATRQRDDAAHESRLAEQASELSHLHQELAQVREALASSESELRRLRESRSASAAAPETGPDPKSARLEATVRARLLLEVLGEAATGLRRELGLPHLEGVPARRVEESLVPAAKPGPVASTTVGAAQIEQLLGLPRSRLIIDGYNVTMSAWPGLSLETQRSRLSAAVAAVAVRTGVEATVVFDAHLTGVEGGHRPVVPHPKAVKVFFSPPGRLADDVIRDLVGAEPAGRPVIVVTSDQEVADDVRRVGARVVDSAAFVRMLTP